MRAAYFADAHVGNHRLHAGDKIAGLNERCRLSLRSVQRACAAAHTERVDVIISLGDLIDNTRPEPQVLRALQETFLEQEITVALLLGNHERVSGLEKDHALMPLAVENVLVFDRPGALNAPKSGWPSKQGGFVAMVPFQDGPAAEWIEKAINEARSDGNGACQALALHLGLRDEKISASYPWAAEAKDAIDVLLLAELCRKYQIPQVYAGNWHSWAEWEFMWPDDEEFIVRMTQVGALTPTGWDNPGVDGYGSLAIMGGHDKRIRIDGPRFLNVTGRRDLQKQRERAGVDDVLFVRAKTPPSSLSRARDELRGELEDDQHIGGWEVVVDTEVARDAARSAATAARSSSTVRDAVDAYFKGLDLEVDKAKVQAKTIEYLGLK